MSTRGTSGLLILALLLGCDSGPGRGAMGDVDGTGDVGPADAAADDGTPPDPSPEEPGPPFQLPAEEARLLPFSVRMQNLAHVTGQPLDHPMFATLAELRLQLGDHDFAAGVAPDLRWSPERMQLWLRGLEPVCASTELAAAYPSVLTDPRPLMRQAWGREPSVEEVEAIAGLQHRTVGPKQQRVVTCLAVLTALEHVCI